MGKSSNTIKSQHTDIKAGLKCQHCGKDFKYESERKRHEQSHSPQFACKVCSKKFSFMSALRRHEKQHERTGSVYCDECNRKFRDESLLKRHIQYAHKGTFICNKCDAIFSSDIALRSHMKTHNLESERRFRCSFDGCKKTFNFAHHLRHHELTHTNTKQHFCIICGKGFIQYHHLKSHVRRHTPESWVHCSVPSCNKTFATVYALKKHLGTHKNALGTRISDIDSPGGLASIISDYADDKCNDTITDSSFPESDTVKGDSRDLHLQVADLKLQSKCSLDEVDIDGACESHTQIQETVIDESVDSMPVSICNSYLGECIMENDANGNQKCLCAQVPCPIEDTYDFVANKIQNTANKSKCFNIVKVQPDKIRPKSCTNCNCDDRKEQKNFSDESSINDSSNVIEEVIVYKSDGTVKIKESFDMDLDLSKTLNDKISKEIPPNTVPFNSCKDVLGKCIVSGNGTIGEGCLCAKMAVNDQPMIEQEIDELTPCPKMY